MPDLLLLALRCYAVALSGQMDQEPRIYAHQYHPHVKGRRQRTD